MLNVTKLVAVIDIIYAGQQDTVRWRKYKLGQRIIYLFSWPLLDLCALTSQCIIYHADWLHSWMEDGNIHRIES